MASNTAWKSAKDLKPGAVTGRPRSKSLIRNVQLIATRSDSLRECLVLTSRNFETDGSEETEDPYVEYQSDGCVSMQLSGIEGYDWQLDVSRNNSDSPKASKAIAYMGTTPALSLTAATAPKHAIQDTNETGRADKEDVYVYCVMFNCNLGLCSPIEAELTEVFSSLEAANSRARKDAEEDSWTTAEDLLDQSRIDEDGCYSVEWREGR